MEGACSIAAEVVGREHTLPPRQNPTELRRGLEIELDGDGHSLDVVLDRLRRVMLMTPSSASPDYLNQLFGGREPLAAAAEMLTAVTNTSMYTFKVAAPHILVEQEVLGRMMRIAGFDGGDGMFTPGGSMANLAAALVARNEKLPAVRDRGMAGFSPTLYTSAEGHYSIRKNAGILGVGRRHARDVPTDSAGRMDVAALDRMVRSDLETGLTPLLVNATAGTTVLGAFDPIREIAAVAEEHGLWLHVDGAFGATALLSTEHRGLLDGLELAHSLSWDAHKMMGIPLSCSVVLFRRPGVLTAHLDESADYLFQADSDELNPGRRSLQCGRRNDALKLWAAWQHLGDQGWDRRVRRQFALAAYAAGRIEADPDLLLAAVPQSINVCFEVVVKPSAETCRLLDDQASLKIGHGTGNGREVIRMVCVNPDLDEDRIDRVLSVVKAAAARL